MNTRLKCQALQTAWQCHPVEALVELLISVIQCKLFLSLTQDPRFRNSRQHVMGRLEHRSPSWTPQYPTLAIALHGAHLLSHWECWRVKIALILMKMDEIFQCGYTRLQIFSKSNHIFRTTNHWKPCFWNSENGWTDSHPPPPTQNTPQHPSGLGYCRIRSRDTAKMGLYKTPVCLAGFCWNQNGWKRIG